MDKDLILLLQVIDERVRFFGSDRGAGGLSREGIIKIRAATTRARAASEPVVHGGGRAGGTYLQGPVLVKSSASLSYESLDIHPEKWTFKELLQGPWNDHYTVALPEGLPNFRMDEHPDLPPGSASNPFVLKDTPPRKVRRVYKGLQSAIVQHTRSEITLENLAAS
ncbi:hypothetical protein DFH09DRAFT_1100835 [Mycena vulgaris]|nr:hypothetical protein DFH09DRAFT_1100835 [Mycena vulgaris]